MTVIETLGSATALCVDKTGTLTENRMTVHTLVTGTGARQCDAAVDAAGLTPRSRHCSPPRCSLRKRIRSIRWKGHCISLRARRCAIRPLDGRELVHEYPLTTELLAMTHVWSAPDGGVAVAATKGAPEAIAMLCRDDQALPATIDADAATLAAEGMRVLGVARAECKGPPWPPDPRSMRFTWLGLVAFADPLRANVPHAIAQCHAAGIRVMMITGDYPATARAIAREAGIPADAFLSGSEIAALGEVALRARVRDTCVSRVSRRSRNCGSLPRCKPTAKSSR